MAGGIRAAALTIRYTIDIPRCPDHCGVRFAYNIRLMGLCQCILLKANSAVSLRDGALYHHPVGAAHLRGTMSRSVVTTLRLYEEQITRLSPFYQVMPRGGKPENWRLWCTLPPMTN